MSVNISIRNIPEDVRDIFAARAEASGRSMQEYLRAELIALSAKPSAAEWFVRARAIAATMPPISSDDIVAAIREGRRY